MTVGAAPGPGGAGIPAAIRVLLVDDHSVVREGVRAMLAPEPDIEVAGEAGSGDEAVAQARVGADDVILMDLRMPGTDGVDAIGQILAADPAARIVVLTTYETDADILRAVEAGAAGYLLKDAPRGEVANAIRVAARGDTVLSPSVAARLVTRVRRPHREPRRRARWRCCNSSGGARPTPTSGGACSSARRPSRPTCSARSASWASRTGPPP